MLEFGAEYLVLLSFRNFSYTEKNIEKPALLFLYTSTIDVEGCKTGTNLGLPVAVFLRYRHSH